MNLLNTMKEDVFALPATIEAQIGILDERIRTQFSYDELLSIKSIILTGCGDSYYAGKASQYFFNKLCGIPTMALTSMDAGRYFLTDAPDSLPNNPLVMATSVSGKVIRTVEAMQVAQARGCLTVALTGHPEAPLAQTSKHLIDTTLAPLPEPGEVDIPGVRSYRMTLLVHYLFAIHLAEVAERITMADGDRLRAELKKTAADIQATIDASDGAARQLAEKLLPYNYFLFVGDGPGRATAEFCAAKIIEAAGKISFPQDTEEWAHIQFYETAVPATPTFLISSGHRSHSRMQQLVPTMKAIGRTVIAISPEGDQRLNPLVDHVLPVKGNVSEYFAPMVYPVGAELFSAYLAEKLKVPYFRDEIDYYRQEGNARIRTGSPETLKDFENELIQEKVHR